MWEQCYLLETIVQWWIIIVKVCAGVCFKRCLCSRSVCIITVIGVVRQFGVARCWTVIARFQRHAWPDRHDALPSIPPQRGREASVSDALYFGPVWDANVYIDRSLRRQHPERHMGLNQQLRSCDDQHRFHRRWGVTRIILIHFIIFLVHLIFWALNQLIFNV